MAWPNFVLVLAGVAALSARFTVNADIDPIAGYTPVSDVVPHSELDLDMQELSVAADLETEEGFEAAWTAYAVGGNRCDQRQDITKNCKSIMIP